MQIPKAKLSNTQQCYVQASFIEINPHRKLHKGSADIKLFVYSMVVGVASGTKFASSNLK